MWPWRRARAPAETEGEPPAKKARLDGSNSGSSSSSSAAAAAEGQERPRSMGDSLPPEKFRELQEVQLQLQLLDEKCAEEQMAIQRKYDKLRRPYFDRRSKLLRQVPGFWQTALAGHPMRLTNPVEAEALRQVTELDVRENLDNACSYEVRLTFGHQSNRSHSPPVSRLFRERQAVKRVGFQDGAAEPASIQPAKLTALREQGTAVLTAVSGRASGEEPQPKQRSVLGWMLSSNLPGSATAAAKDPVLGDDDLGDVLRRDLWQDPLPYYLEGQQKRDVDRQGPGQASQ